MKAAEIEDLVETIPAQCGLFASTTRTCYAEGGESLTVQVRLVPAEEYASLDDWVFMHEDGLDYPRLRDMVCDFIIENRGNDMGKSDIEGRDRYPHHHPDELEKRDNEEKAKRNEIEEYVDSWQDDELTPDAQADPLIALIEDDSGLLQEIVKLYREGSSVWLERAARDLARVLIEHIKSRAGG
jgi:hypothetical protein